MPFKIIQRVYDQKIASLLKNCFFPAILILLVGFLFYKNYVPGTWLSGWDTLHPELNISLYLQRAFSGVWQEHQGLGAVAVQAQAAELPRLLIVCLLSIFLPLNLIRYSFFFLCLALGAIGIYFLSNYLLFIQNSKYRPHASFLASLFYVFNLATAQQFYVPLEMFAVQYATLPWLFLTAIGYIRTGKRSAVVWFVLFSIFSASMAHTATLFYVYLGTLMVYVCSVSLITRERELVKRSVVLLLLTVALNTYWLLPNLYFLKSTSDAVINANINSNFSEEAFLNNKTFGNLTDMALSKNYLFNWQEYDFKTNGFVDLMGVWEQHLRSPYVRYIGYLIFAVAVSGMLISIVKRNVYLTSFLPVVLICVFFLINANPPFEQLFNYLRDHSDLIKEGFRFPYNKFSILFAILLSLYFANAWAFIMGKIRKIYLPTICLFLTAGAIIYFGLPTTKGYLISPSMKVSIPNAYFEMFRWFEGQNHEARVAKVPLQTFWGWNFYSWGYQGGGFTWFGIPQPTLDREFDRWSPYNETFYNEISTALYGNNPELFKKILQKYDVSFLLVDESIIDPNQTNQDILRYKETRDMLASFHVQEVWSKDFLHVYDVRPLTGYKPFLYSPTEYSKVQTNSVYARKDEAYTDNGPYISLENQSIIYPFSSLLKFKLQNASYKDNTVILSGDVPNKLSGYDLVVPPLATGTTYTTFVKVSYLAHVVNVKFPSNSVNIGNQHIQLSQLPDVSISTDGNFRTIIVNVGDRQVRVDNGTSEQTETNFEVNKPITIEYFDKNNVSEINGQEYIPFAYIQNTVINADAWDTLTKEQRYQIGDDQGNISFLYESFPQTLDFYKRAPDNCDLHKRGAISKTITGGNIIVNSSEYGVLCDGINLTDVSQKYSYLLRWRVQNVSGRGIKFYLHNLASDRNDMEELLPERTVDSTYSILAWPNLINEGYYLGYENRSFGQPSSNVLDKVEVYKLPLDFISQIYLEPQNLQSKIKNSTDITDVWKFATYEYGTNINSPADNGVIVLSQGYDNGWLAFRGPLFNFSFLKHTKYNDWANAWILPKGTYSITIVFLPQLLNFAGYLLFIITLPIVIVRSLFFHQIGKKK